MPYSNKNDHSGRFTSYTQSDHRFTQPQIYSQPQQPYCNYQLKHQQILLHSIGSSRQGNRGGLLDRPPEKQPLISSPRESRSDEMGLHQEDDTWNYAIHGFHNLFEKHYQFPPECFATVSTNCLFSEEESPIDEG